MEEGEEVASVIPTMYRWISTSRITAPVEGTEEAPEKTMALSLCVPIAALPEPEDSGDVGEKTTQSIPLPTPRCDVEGCESLRKYRLVKDWAKGACGMPHLKALETQFATMAH